MIPTLPPSFHVERVTPRCANPACRRKITAEKAFCLSCWHRLSAGTRQRITTYHASRNRPGLVSNIRRAITELSPKPTLDPKPTLSPKPTEPKGTDQR